MPRKEKKMAIYVNGLEIMQCNMFHVALLKVYGILGDSYTQVSATEWRAADGSVVEIK